MDIKINKEIPINLEKLVDSKLLIQANSGGGKSYLMRRILEQSHGKVQQIVLDPEGEYGSLREKYEYLIAGQGHDIVATPQSATLLAHRLLEFKASTIIDLYEMHPQDRRHFVKLFLEALINSPKELHHPCLIFLDEAHLFAPEKGESEALQAVIDLASRGRKRGFGLVLATQRISKLHKDAAAECNNKLIGRTGLDIDRKRAAEEIGFTHKEDVLSLRTLEPGEFYAFGPAISSDVIKLKVGEVTTSHPKAGARGIMAPLPPTAKIKGILAKLSDLPQEAKKQAQTMDELRTEIRTLKAHRCPKVMIDKDETTRVAREAVRHTERIAEMKLDGWKKYVRSLEAKLGKINELSSPENLKKPEGTQIATFAVKNVEDSVIQDKPTLIEKIVYKEARRLSGEIDGISGSEQRLLDAIAWFESIGVNEPLHTAVAFVAGYSVTSGGYKNPRSSLRVKGHVEYRGDAIALSETGRTLASFPDVAPTTEDLHEKVMKILDTPEQKLLKPLLEAYPGNMTHEDVAAAAGYQVTSGGYKNPRSRLRTLGLVEYLPNGRIKASPILFVE